METHLTIDQDSPVNQIELSMVQSNDTYELVENKLIDSSFACIRAVSHIHNQSIQYLYKLDDDGKYIRVYDKTLELFLKHRYALPDLADSHFECEHIKVFIKAVQAAVVPFIYDEDIYSLWNSQPNRRFPHYDEESGQLKSNKTTVELKNALTHEISKLVNTPEFKASITARLERTKHQFKRSSKLVKVLRAKFSKLLVLRIDLCWKAAIQDDSTFDEMKAYFSQLLKRFHYDPTLPNIVGYIWKLEFGQKKGYHYHCMFFMDGNKFQNDTHYAEVIGQHWAKLTLNKGYYFNCHRDKIKYRNLAIGMAHHNDQTFYDNLDQVLVYICKQDQFLIDKRLLNRNLRVFGTSQLPSKASPVGRPRDFKNLPKPSTSLAVVVKKKQLRSAP